MKHIIKGKTPSELKRWFRNQPIFDGEPINCGYADMPSEVKQVIKQRLLDEQGGLCCYTGLRVKETTSHIEHLKPQSQCQNHEDVEYNNLLAAYPGPNAHQCPYGAHAKADWYDAELLVTPLRGDCESRFRFDQSGHIKPANENDLAATRTIKQLCLDHESLTDLRKQAIVEALIRKNKPHSPAKLRQIIQKCYERNANGKFRPFCFVIVQAAEALLRKAERRRKGKQAIGSQTRQ
jgi:uncharacterized protein (TIGR02646 family)